MEASEEYKFYLDPTLNQLRLESIPDIKTIVQSERDKFKAAVLRSIEKRRKT